MTCWRRPGTAGVIEICARLHSGPTSRVGSGEAWVEIGSDAVALGGSVLVGVAVRADGPVGLDVEQVRDVADLDALAEHVCSPAERARGDLDPAADGEPGGR